LFKKYFHAMLKRGVYLPPSAFESWFLNNALSYADLDETISKTKGQFAGNRLIFTASTCCQLVEGGLHSKAHIGFDKLSLTTFQKATIPAL